MVHPVGYKYIAEAIVIHIKHKPCPAPICSVHPTEIGYFGKGAIPVVELQGVLYVLLIKILALL